MAHINFVIPLNKSELLKETDDHYYVKNITGPKNIFTKINEAKQSLKDDGVEFIIDHFDHYYSVLHHSDSIPMSIITKAFLDLHKAVQDLDKTIGFILNDKESLVDNTELKMKFLNITSMLFYVYTNIAILIENKSRTTTNLQTKNRNKKANHIDEAISEFNKKSILIALNNILQKEIILFWDPPVAEEMFINMVAEVCYTFLENEIIKHEKEVRIELYSMIGTLLTTYNHGTTCLVRLVQLIKAHEHFIQCIPEGIQFLIENFNTKSLVHDFVKEITEWQIDESVQDAQGTRYCALVLSNMAVLMPSLMLPEVMYLNQYLNYESYPLRNSVLSVITEVIVNVLNKPGLNEEELEFRNEFLDVLEEHLYDVSAHVRSKVYLHWIRLQTEMAVPMEKQNAVLKKATMALTDKSALVRKNAANCITGFLSHNFYGHKLKISYMKTQLEAKQNELYKIRGNDEEAKQFLVDHNDDIHKAAEEAFKEQFEVDIEVPDKNVADVIFQYIKDKKFKEAICLIHKEGDKIADWQQLEADADDEEKVEFYLFMLGRIFLCASKAPQPNLNEEELKSLKELEDSVIFYKNAIDFLETIKKAIKPMSNLLESATVGDMQEAVEFFIAAHKFDIDDATEGILEMLKIMQRSETERKDIVTEALRKIYLQTDENNKQTHSIIVVNRLINLVKMVSFQNLDDVKVVISEWARKNILDNTIIRTLWKYFSKEIDVSDDDARAALFLLFMASCGRKSIIEHNIKYVANISFGERGQNDLLLVSIACELLAVFGREKQDITAANPPQRIKYTDEMWKQLINIFIEKFDKPVAYYKKAFSSCAQFVYEVCSKPDVIFEEFIKTIILKMHTSASATDVHEIDSFILARCCHILGEVAIRQLDFLDNDVFKELKRRNYNRENKKRQSSKTSNVDKNIISASKSAIDASILSQQGEDGTLEGAQAEDGDVEFILNVLENNTVTGSSMLGKLAYIVKRICQYPNQYDEPALQGSAVIALLRYMLVSSRFCTENVQLIFTILEKTKYSHVKCSILIHCSDLLERFPNVIEPWTPRLTLRLKDPEYEVRKATFYMLANLSLKDMIRVHSYVSEMAVVIVDPDEKLSDMSKNFFIMLTRKGNNLCNALPDIFSHLSANENITEDKLQFIMKFLFELIDKAKLMESLVDRFCIKLQMTENEYVCTNIAYCLTLITYNDKGAKRLLNQFDAYKHSLHFNGVYSSFKTILNGLNKQQKNEVKAIAVELEDKIKTFFEINQNENPQNPLPVFKKPKGRARKKTKKRNDTDDQIDEDLSHMDE